MPIYEYQAAEGEKGCKFCANGFERIQTLSEPKLEKCPECGAIIVRVISAPAVGKSVSSLDDRAKAAGFTKLKRLGKGEYEKQY
jgi:putative FmdB family regulatory protein